jgi:2,5-diamino-6-(ribosylamino)-4(3H)-pyrimidinone 5'-phosphate reductase
MHQDWRKSMLPKVVIHNSISLDGSLTGFEPNMGLHYQIAGRYKSDVHLVGSRTVKIGVEMYGERIPPEEKKDYEKPERTGNVPYWVVPDTKGVLKGLLHTCRRFQFCRDVIVLISESTPKEYFAYLKERNYDYYVVGRGRVDLKRSLELLSSKYKTKKVLADTGRILGNLLLEHGLVLELSLLIHPVVVGKKSYNMFGNITRSISLKLYKKEIFPKGYIWLVYRVRDESS